MTNPFRTSGPVTEDGFADRAGELWRIRRALTDPGGVLLVYGERRQGKTSVLLRAAHRARASGHPVVYADLSVASGTAEMAATILQAAASIGADPRSTIYDLLKHVRVEVSVRTDERGMPYPTFGATLAAGGSAEESHATIAHALDGIERYAQENEVVVGLILDEFQRLHQIGGNDAEWVIRSAIQRHERIAYVLSGSDPTMGERMAEKGAPLYGMVTPLHLGPIESDFLRSWIAERFGAAGIPDAGAADRIVDAAGPRTGDVIRLARATFDRCAERAGAEEVQRALAEIVMDSEPAFLHIWDGLAEHQRSMARAAADGVPHITSGETLRRYGVTHSATAVRAIARLRELDLVRRAPEGEAAFEIADPFFRAWLLSKPPHAVTPHAF